MRYFAYFKFDAHWPSLFNNFKFQCVVHLRLCTAIPVQTQQNTDNKQLNLAQMESTAAAPHPSKQKLGRGASNSHTLAAVSSTVEVWCCKEVSTPATRRVAPQFASLPSLSHRPEDHREVLLKLFRR